MKRHGNRRILNYSTERDEFHGIGFFTRRVDSAVAFDIDTRGEPVDSHRGPRETTTEFAEGARVHAPSGSFN